MAVDPDVTQIAYCGADKFFMSPLALQAHHAGSISIRRGLGAEAGMAGRVRQSVTFVGAKFFNIGVQHPLKSIPEASRDIKKRFQER